MLYWHRGGKCLLLPQGSSGLEGGAPFPWPEAPCRPALLLPLCLCLAETAWEPPHRGERRRLQEGREGAWPWAGGDCSAPFPVQAREPELGEQYEAVCDSTYSEAESAAAEVLDLPLPSYFRSRSHSYLRAIQAGCSQDEDTGSIRSISPPPAGSLSGSRTLPTNSECQRGHGSRGDGV